MVGTAVEPCRDVGGGKPFREVPALKQKIRILAFSFTRLRCHLNVLSLSCFRRLGPSCTSMSNILAIDVTYKPQSKPKTSCSGELGLIWGAGRSRRHKEKGENESTTLLNNTIGRSLTSREVSKYLRDRHDIYEDICDCGILQIIWHFQAFPIVLMLSVSMSETPIQSKVEDDVICCSPAIGQA